MFNDLYQNGQIVLSGYQPTGHPSGLKYQLAADLLVCSCRISAPQTVTNRTLPSPHGQYEFLLGPDGTVYGRKTGFEYPPLPEASFTYLFVH